MGAAELRKAADTLRERAGLAWAGPWQADGPFWVDPPGVEPSEITVQTRAGVTAGTDRVLIYPGTWESRDSDATYIATMHPGVGLALADWLDRAAWAEDLSGYTPKGRVKDHALTVARLINGGAS